MYVYCLPVCLGSYWCNTTFSWKIIVLVIGMMQHRYLHESSGQFDFIAGKNQHYHHNQQLQCHICNLTEIHWVTTCKQSYKHLRFVFSFIGNKPIQPKRCNFNIIVIFLAVTVEFGFCFFIFLKEKQKLKNKKKKKRK